LHRVKNILGWLLVDYLLTLDYTPFMLEHRAKLRDVRRLLSKRL
jgi:hypothetical protein